MNRIAFVAGSNGSQEFGQLKYALSDADTVSSALAGTRCQFQVVRPEQEASPYTFREALDKACALCNPEDTFLCFFAGHGVLDAGELFLVLDQTTSNFQTTALATDDILASIRRCKAQNKLLILDCCHAGGAIRYRGSGTLPIEELRIASANHLVLMASGRLERVREYERLGGGFLSQKLAAALTEQFHEADTNQDLCLTIDELMDFLEKEASWHNRVYDNEKVSIPYIFGEKKGDFFLTPDKSPWRPYEIQWAEGTTMVVLPIPPIDLSKHPDRFDRDSTRAQSGGYVFALGKHPITNAQYRTFLEKDDTNVSSEPQGENFDHQLHRWVGSFFPWRDERFNDPMKPVVCISFDEALNYSRWAHTLASSEIPGTFTDITPYRLWDIATFGTPRQYDMLLGPIFPSFNPRDVKWLKQSASSPINPKAWIRDWHHKALEPAAIDISNQRCNSRGITDLLGNVWEWCGSMNGFLCRAGFPYLSYLPERISLRGGGFFDNLEKISPVLSKSEIPNGKESHHSDHGFRIAAILPFEILPSEIQLHLKLLPSVEVIDAPLNATITEASDW